MNKKKCNRCGKHERRKYGGSLELKHGQVTIMAWLCQSCYDDIVVAYENGDENV